MDISTASIEVAISTYTAGLDANRAAAHSLAMSGDIEAAREAAEEAIRISGIIQGLVYALNEIRAQQQGYGEMAAIRHEEEIERSIAEHDRQMDAEHA